MKSCRSCEMENPDDAKFCNHCGEPLRAEDSLQSQPAKVDAKRKRVRNIAILVVVLISILCSWLGYIHNILSTPEERTNQQFPSFTTNGRYSPAISIVVPSNTTKEGLKALIYQFRNARRAHRLTQIIPPTTPGGKPGDYFVVWIFVFSESWWASSEQLKAFMNEDWEDPGEVDFARRYEAHIRAVYYYAPRTGIEYGSLGYEDEDKRYRTAGYEKLF